MASAMDLTALEKDPRLFLYTSLTAGSSHIITATSRMETILKANKIPFQAIDIATDEKARRLWQRRAGQRKIPGLVKEGFVLGDLNEVEEWNEFGELRENIGPVPANNAAPKGGQVGVQTAPPLSHNVSAAGAPSSKATTVSKAPQQTAGSSKGIALPGAAEIAALNKKPTTTGQTADVSKTASSAAPSAASVKFKDELKQSQPAVDHLSAPASRIQSGTATPVTTEEKTVDTPVAAAQSTAEKPVEKVEQEKPSIEAEKEKSADDATLVKPVGGAAEEKTANEEVKEKLVEGADKEKHRGSDIVEAPSEEIKKVETQNQLVEEDEEDAKDTTAQTTTDLKALNVDEQETTEAKESKAEGEKAA
ncbi:Putative SH3-binding, glutamic acid-rich protein [Septoria linicola]|uniref:SH3-binding, glutamic acid-rich protein n=1 Tax=Septoria linicola TaxID=215465 RepID=A0A9Q9ALF7_9PEZI|nr:putative SH3-binding, glutamic acid-rich protein [Septoria linicola]USW46976.1 Putative SH3-binding, glutamic acid-rich protein [Septoria linicola]